MSSTNREVLEALRKAFPQLFTVRTDEDGQVVERLDLEKIRLLAGEGNYSDRYGLRWEDKPERFDEESVGKLPSLKHVPGKSLHVDPTKPTHVLVQGDNYHALKVLTYTHERSVDVIYIDPPYNTGNKDFKYNDKFVDREDGYRHSKWLSFMEKRLRLAKHLLKDDGVIFISIDDDEQASLRLLCDEIFGEAQFLNTIVWTFGKMSNESRKFSNNHEYIHVYGRSAASKLIPSLKKEDTEYKTRWAGFVRDNKIHYGDVKHKRDKMIQARIADYVKLNGAISDEVVLYDFDKEYKVDSDVIYCSIIKGNAEEKVANFGAGQKPIELLQRLIAAHPNRNAVVLDFFAGSGSTLHAVMELNVRDKGNRTCVLVTNDEGEFKDADGKVLPGGICTHVTYPRLKKVIEGYTTPKGKEVPGLGDNLEFFETAFQAVPKSRRQLQAFVRHSTSLLQLKAGCFTQVEATSEWSLHTDGTKHLFILFDDCAVDAAVERLRAVEGPVVAFVFAYDSDDDSNEILGKLPNVTVQEVPQPLLDLFLRIKE